MTDEKAYYLSEQDINKIKKVLPTRLASDKGMGGITSNLIQIAKTDEDGITGSHISASDPNGNVVIAGEGTCTLFNLDNEADPLTDTSRQTYMSKNPDNSPNTITAYNLSSDSISPNTFIQVVQTGLGDWLVVSAGEGGLVPLRLQKSGGSDGSATSSASWTYNVRLYGTSPILLANWDITRSENNPLNQNEYRRPELGRIRPATFGTGLFTTNGLIITDCNEISRYSTCS